MTKVIAVMFIAFVSILIYSTDSEVESNNISLKPLTKKEVEELLLNRPTAQLKKEKSPEEMRFIKYQTEGYGEIPYVKIVTPQVMSVVEAKRTKKYLYRLNPQSTGVPKFNHKNYIKDTKMYLDEHVPGRVFQVAQPGKDVKKLEILSSYLHQVEQNEERILKVKAIPNAPVTFTAFHGGYFKESQLLSITVKADGQGIAQATFVAPPGVIRRTEIGVGCPLTSRRLKFIMDVYLVGELRSIKE